MTELECSRQQYFLMKKMAYELQSALHQLSQNMLHGRHRGTLEDCTEQSCILFVKAYSDIERMPLDMILKNKIEGAKE